MSNTVITARWFAPETAALVKGLIKQLEDLAKEHGALRHNQHFELLVKGNTRTEHKETIQGDKLVKFLNMFLSQHGDHLTKGQKDKLAFIRDNAHQDVYFWKADEQISIVKFINNTGLQTLLHKYTGLIRVSPRVGNKQTPGGYPRAGTPTLRFHIGETVSVID